MNMIHIFRLKLEVCKHAEHILRKDATELEVNVKYLA